MRGRTAGFLLGPQAPAGGRRQKDRRIALKHPLVINLGVGRSGTTYAFNVLRERYEGRAYVMHEDMNARRARLRRFFRCYEPERIDAALADAWVASWVEKVDEMTASRPVIVTGSTTSHLAPVLARVFGERLRVFHVHRHPLNVCAASYVGPWDHDWHAPPSFEKDSTAPVLTPADPWVRHVEIEPRWSSLGPFAHIAYGWLERTGAGREFASRYPEVPHRLLSAEPQLFASEEWLEAVAGFAGLPVLPGVARKTPSRNTSWVRSVEERPLGDAWTQLRQLPELVALASSLGHGFGEEELAGRAAKYQLPSALGSRLRHATRYWQVRRSWVSSLRRAGIIPHAESGGHGDDPRPTSEAFSETLRHFRDRLRGEDP